jgi:carboxyl-protease
MIKKFVAGIVSASLFLQSFTVYGAGFNDMPDDEKPQAVGAYIEEIIKYINNNYIGEKEVNVDELMYAAIKAMTESLDQYSDYLTPQEYAEIKSAESKVWYAPEFECKFNEDGYPQITEIKSTSKAYQEGLRTGNTIRAIGDVSTYGIGEEEYKTLVTKSDSNSIKMKISSIDSIISEISVPVASVTNPSVEIMDITKVAKGSENVKFDDKSVGYIKITTFSSNTAQEFEKALNQLLSENKTKLILDLRGNTGGYVDEAIKIAQMIVPQGLIISTKDKMGNGVSYTSSLKSTPFNRYVVLVDSVTASASEILASAMQDSGIAKIVGEQTYGKGIMQSVMDFEEAGVIKMTTQEYTTRNGHVINKIGITPDINIKKVLFISENADLSNNEVIAAMRFLGFKVDENNPIEKAIGSYQAEMKLPITHKMDKETVNSINLEIYEDILNNDRVLTAGYINILS